MLRTARIDRIFSAGGNPTTQAAATSFLQIHLPQVLSEVLDWPTLKRLDASFVDEALRGSEADLLYEVAHVSGEGLVWVYLLLEQQFSAV